MVTNAQIANLPGWFFRADVEAFRRLLAATGQRYPEGGDLAELGVYLGKSAALIGGYVRPGETFTVVDLFGEQAGDANNVRENAEHYPDLTRSQFETNYLSIHSSLPMVITGLSHTIAGHSKHGAHRFVHIDASHLFENVVADLAVARRLLMPDGVVVLDDYRSEHTPGVAAAAWRAQGLRPFLLTTAKMYATWGDPEPWTTELMLWLSNSTADHHEVQKIGDDEVLRVWSNTPRFKKYVPPVAIPALVRIRARFPAD